MNRTDTGAVAPPPNGLAESGTHELIRKRWSPLAFSPQAVEPDVLRSLFEAARWAPSSYNEQPWFFVFAARGDGEAFERLANLLVEANQRWARGAPVLLLSVARTSFARNGKPNRHAFHDVGLAMGNLLLEATARGLAVHQMAGFDVERAQIELKLPVGFEAVAAAALGYPGDPAALPADLRERQLAPRSRKPLGETVWRGEWGRPGWTAGLI